MSIELHGNWQKGFALDLHTISSTYLGPDEFGHDRYDTTRSEVGEWVYKLKYRSDTSVVPQIVARIQESIGGIEKLDAVVESHPFFLFGIPRYFPCKNGSSA